MNQEDNEIWCSLLLGIERAEHFGQHAESPIRYTKSLTTGEIISSLCTSYSRRNECRLSWLVRLPRLDRNKCEILHNAPWFLWRLAKFRRKRSLWAMTLDEKSCRSFWQERNPSNDVFHASSYLFFRQGFNSIGMNSTVPNSICLSGLVHSFTSIFERCRR